MPYQKSETVELKSVVIDDIKKKLLLLQTVTVENCTLVFRMTAQLSVLMTQTMLHCKSVIWLLSDQNIHTIKVAVFKDHREFSGSLIKLWQDFLCVEIKIFPMYFTGCI